MWIRKRKLIGKKRRFDTYFDREKAITFTIVAKSSASDTCRSTYGKEIRISIGFASLFGHKIV